MVVIVMHGREWPPIKAQDDVYFRQVQTLLHTAAMAVEEAEAYAKGIADADLRARAERLIDNLF